MYVSGNLGGRGISQAYDEVRTHAMIDVATDRVAVPLSFGSRNLIISKRFASAADLSFYLFLYICVLRDLIDISVHMSFGLSC